MNKILYAFHVVLTIHNSRTSKRMIKYKVHKKPSQILNDVEELALTSIFKAIIKEKAIRCLAYNICLDHVHLLIVCPNDELASNMKILKGKSSYLFTSGGYKNKGTPLWSQKYYWSCLNNWKLSKRNSNDNYLDTTIEYIINNRQKHGLLDHPELKKIIASFISSKDEAFGFT